MASEANLGDFYVAIPAIIIFIWILWSKYRENEQEEKLAQKYKEIDKHYVQLMTKIKEEKDKAFLEIMAKKDETINATKNKIRLLYSEHQQKCAQELVIVNQKKKI